MMHSKIVQSQAALALAHLFVPAADHKGTVDRDATQLVLVDPRVRGVGRVVRQVQFETTKFR